ncbi:hypothetical protein [Haliangium ochraceum]|nr:hypothetical protein [Haliangium ochraceum]
MLDERLNLTVHLERSGESLRISYFDAKARPIDGLAGSGAQIVPLSQLDQRARGDAAASEGGNAGGLAAIGDILERGDASELVQHFTQSDLVEFGHTLFYVLFGSSTRWEPVIRALFDERGEVRPNPPRRSVRVRIFTNIDMLVDLPWRLTAWKGKYLVDSGWTFEVVSALESNAQITFESPCPILVIAPQFAGMEDIDSDTHLEALRQTLPAPYLTPVHFRVVRTRGEVRDAFRGMHPRVLYYYGHGEIRGGQVCLLLGDGSGPADAINAFDLKQLMGGHFPQAAYINACKSGASGWHSVGYQLSPEVPVVIANPTTSWSQHAGRAAVAWLVSCLEHGYDPVIAAHAIDEQSSTRGFEWGMRTVHANYGEWRAEPLVTLGPLSPIGLRLDRELIRERVQGLVTNLVRGDERRVGAIVSYAVRGNRIDLVFDQMKDQLEDNAAHLAQVSWRKVSFPRERDNLAQALRRDLAFSLGAASDEPLPHALRRCARGLDLPGAMPVLWLSWGPFGRYQEQVIDFGELRTWVELCSELAQICPGDIRVVAFLSIETEDAPHTRLEQEVHALALEHMLDEAFACDLIPPLPSVTLVDIARFLSDKNNARCPPTLAQELTRHIYRRSKGNFEHTLALIERGESEGWYVLLKELRAEEPARAPDGLII